MDFGKEFSILSTFKILGMKKEDLNFYHERLRLIVNFATGFNLSEDEKKIYIDAAIEMENAILNLISEKKKFPDNDLVSFILTEGANDEGKKLSNSDIVACSPIYSLILLSKDWLHYFWSMKK
ncbi:hypothetical protein [Xenorhabdus japonica]|uniref:hypothetical protein n=1 Tax=Xenorhabdus japonica TaxID=53341 RepID=UPI001113EA44|nr:hypothetical protein [Xenorhabdus japonica]